MLILKYCGSRLVSTYDEEIVNRGKLVKMGVTLICDKEIVTTGKYIKIARIKEEWDTDVEDPGLLIEKLKEGGVKADIFTFMQRLPESKPKSNYYMEWDNVAAVPIKNYDHWWYKQIAQKARNKVRKSEKNGIVVKVVDLNDELIRGITGIYNETPVRQGKPYWNYGFDFNLTKKENTPFLDRAVFIGAYFKDELIGYIRIVNAGRFARTMGILSKVKHRDRAPTNALLAKAVEVCAEKKIPYLVYAKYDYGKLGSDTLVSFKLQNGFESIILPKYYVPLTIKGMIALKLHLHHGVIGVIPKRLVRIQRDLRNKWYTR